MNEELNQAKSDLIEEFTSVLKRNANPLMGGPFTTNQVEDLVSAIDDYIEAKVKSLAERE